MQDLPLYVAARGSSPGGKMIIGKCVPRRLPTPIFTDGHLVIRFTSSREPAMHRTNGNTVRLLITSRFEEVTQNESQGYTGLVADG